MGRDPPEGIIISEWKIELSKMMRLVRGIALSYDIALGPLGCGTQYDIYV